MFIDYVNFTLCISDGVGIVLLADAGSFYLGFERVEPAYMRCVSDSRVRFQRNRTAVVKTKLFQRTFGFDVEVISIFVLYDGVLKFEIKMRAGRYPLHIEQFLNHALDRHATYCCLLVTVLDNDGLLV